MDAKRKSKPRDAPMPTRHFLAVAKATCEVEKSRGQRRRPNLPDPFPFDFLLLIFNAL